MSEDLEKLFQLQGGAKKGSKKGSSSCCWWRGWIKTLEHDIKHFVYTQYNVRSIAGGIGLISVLNSCSIRYKFWTSSFVIILTARPRCPNRPDRPIRCKYVSAVRGKSKLITQLTVGISIPRVKRSEETKWRVPAFRNSWKTLFLSAWSSLAWI